MNFRKNCPYDSNEILYSHSTPFYGPMCARASKSYDWNPGESEGKRPKPIPLPHMRLWLNLGLIRLCHDNTEWPT